VLEQNDDRMRKTRKHRVMLVCIVAWFGDFARRGLSSSLHGRKLLLAFARWHDNGCRSTFAFSGSCYSLEYCLIADDELLLSWNWLVVRPGSRIRSRKSL